MQRIDRNKTNVRISLNMRHCEQEQFGTHINNNNDDNNNSISKAPTYLA